MLFRRIVVSYQPEDPSEEFRFTNWMVTREIIKAITAILSLVCDIIIMKTILHLNKFKKLRYFYMFHFCLLHIFYCLDNFYIVFFDCTEIKGYHKRRPKNYSLYYNKTMKITEDFLFLLIFIVSFLIIVDYFFKVLWTRLYTFYNSINFVVKYLFYTAFPILLLTYYIASRTIKHLKILNIIFCFIFIFTIISYILCCIKKIKCKSNLTLFISTILSLTFLPYLILQNIENSLEKQHLIINYFFADCALYLSSFFAIICLVLNEKKIGKAVLNCIKHFGKN